jgi:GcrA cell cycle regulator
MSDWRPPVSEEIRQAIRELWDEGLSTADIGRRVGKTKNAIVGLAHRMGLPKRPSPIGKKGEGSKQQRRRGRPRKPPHSPLYVAPAPAPPCTFQPPKPNECQWPLWGMQMPHPHEQRFCGKRARVGSPYCDEHHAIAYRSAAA